MSKIPIVNDIVTLCDVMQDVLFAECHAWSTPAMLEWVGQMEQENITISLRSIYVYLAVEIKIFIKINCVISGDAFLRSM